jgi:hypothetical protein
MNKYGYVLCSMTLLAAPSQQCGTGGPGNPDGGGDTCPAFSSEATLIVNADPLVGADNACCGRMSAAGLGGPCLTLTRALEHVNGSQWTVVANGDVFGNASASEVYPIRLGNGVTLELSRWTLVPPRAINNPTYFPGVAGKPVFVVDSDPTIVAINGGVLGVNSFGLRSGASDGVFVGTTRSGQPASLSFNGEIQGTANGIRVDGGIVQGGSVMSDVSVGVRCKSSGASPSIVKNSYVVIRASEYGLFASTGCKVMKNAAEVEPSHPLNTVEVAIGDFYDHPGAKKMGTGVHAESDAVVVLRGSIHNANGNAIELKRGEGITVNRPQVSVYDMPIEHAGCAGAYAEVGRIDLHGVSFDHVHYGIIQRSSAASQDPEASLFELQSPYFNSACIGKAEPGTCCTSASCLPGAAIWNNSGLPLTVVNAGLPGGSFDQCTCNAQLQNCTCTGSAAGRTTPPDGIDVINSPLTAGGRSPTTTILEARDIGPATCE